MARGAIVLLFFLLTIEVCARIDDAVRYGAPLWGPYSADQLRSRDLDGIPHNVPGASFQKWHNDSYGFRGTEIAPKPHRETIRVVCLGASESYGLYERGL